MMAETKLYYVELKDPRGNLEPIGVMPKMEAYRLQRQTHRACHMAYLGTMEGTYGK
jgi:hypothetical protein